jgi:hypothetical protein
MDDGTKSGGGQNVRLHSIRCVVRFFSEMSLMKIKSKLTRATWVRLTTLQKAKCYQNLKRTVPTCPSAWWLAFNTLDATLASP